MKISQNSDFRAKNARIKAARDQLIKQFPNAWHPRNVAWVGIMKTSPMIGRLAKQMFSAYRDMISVLEKPADQANWEVRILNDLKTFRCVMKKCLNDINHYHQATAIGSEEDRTSRDVTRVTEGFLQAGAEKYLMDLDKIIEKWESDSKVGQTGRSQMGPHQPRVGQRKESWLLTCYTNLMIDCPAWAKDPRRGRKACKNWPLLLPAMKACNKSLRKIGKDTAQSEDPNLFLAEINGIINDFKNLKRIYKKHLPLIRAQSKLILTDSDPYEDLKDGIIITYDEMPPCFIFLDAKSYLEVLEKARLDVSTMITK